MLLAIDPGADTGWALFGRGVLCACGLGEPPDDVDSPWMYGCEFEYLKVLIECPRLRPRGEKNPNSILLVARNAGEWGGRYFGVGEVSYLTPNDWKGSTPKATANARTWRSLNEGERGVVDLAFAKAKGRKGLAKGKRHNVLDAIGIGLHGVGR